MAEATTLPPEANASTLFKQVTFHIIENGIDQNTIQDLRKSLVNGGATERIGNASSSPNFDLEGVTHVIAGTVDYDFLDRTEERLINVVRPDWVRASMERGRLPNPKQYSADPRMIFSGLVVCVAEDVPEGDRDALVGGIVAMGGLYASQMSRQVTHVVALGMSPRECKVVVEKKLACHIVLPHWFDDCLRLSSRVDEAPYRLPNPALLDGTSFELKEVKRPDMATAMYRRPGHLPDLTGAESAHMDDLDVFAGKSIYLHSDLAISEHLRSTIEDLISVGGGRAINDAKSADTIICQWREGYAYRTASQQGKAVGNLSWLYHLITRNKWTSPLDKLLHYPFAKEGIPGFSQYKLSLSNYSGEARVYLENLAKAAGSTFTKAFKTENTHLITAHERSEKVDAAKEWNIHIVNHLWLEDCYARWQVLPVDLDRYTYLPHKTNMSDLVGQTRIDTASLEKYFYPKASATPKGNRSLADERAEEMRDSEDDSIGQAPEDDVFMTARGNESGERDGAEDLGTIMQDKDLNAGAGKSADPITPAAARKVTKLSRPSKSASKSAKTPKTPKTPKVSAAAGVPDGKENEVPPPTTGGRSAKAAAATKLHSMASDIELFQKEMKRAGGVTHGGRRAKEDTVSDSRPPSRKRSASAEDGFVGAEVFDDDDDDGDDNANDDDGPPSRKKAKPSPVAMRLLITGWGGGRAAQAKAALRDIGIMLTEDPTRCTHVAASRIVRTRKFVCALARGPAVLDTAFVERSLADGRMLDPDRFPLRDAAGERKFGGFSLARSIERARTNTESKAGGLFAGVAVYVTRDIPGGYDTFQDIVRANGGVPHMFTGRPGAIASRRAAAGDTSATKGTTPTSKERKSTARSSKQRRRGGDDHEDDEDDEDEDGDEDGDENDNWDEAGRDIVYLVRGDSPAEARLAEKFGRMAAKAHWRAAVVGSDWLLNSALAQQVLDPAAHAVGAAMEVDD